MVVNWFYSILSGIENRCNNFIKLNSFRIIIRIIRLFLPLYYLWTPKKVGVCNNNNLEKPAKVIISLTTFPARMDKIWVVLESLLRQTRKPDKIILWLASSQFPSLNDINKKVLKMRERGLEIRFCEDLRSHKKYFYALKEYKHDIVITVDDDIFYPENLVENLLTTYEKYPNTVVCYRAHKITFKGDYVNKYKEWDYLSLGVKGPDHMLLSTSGAGKLFPPNCITKEVLNKDAIKELCPFADDIWVKCMEYLSGVPTVKVFESAPQRLFTIKGSIETGLAKSNVEEGKNDKQLKKVMDFYDINFRKLE